MSWVTEVGTPLCILLWLGLCYDISAEFIPKDPEVTAIFGQQVVLPCHFQVEDSGTQIVQVTWYKAPPKVPRTEIATFHSQYGSAVYDPYKDRVTLHAKSVTEDGSLALKKAALADEGQYVCRVVTFPSGNFESTVTLTVIISPHTTLNANPALVEGYKSTLAASCMAEGRPIPIITWETELEGSFHNEITSLGNVEAVTSEFTLWPHRSMNGKELTCVVTHPGLTEPRRIPLILNVKYPPDVTIKSSTENWYIGLETGTLKCIGVGNPAPTNYTWSRQNRSFSEGVKIEQETLKFEKPLTAAEAGIYICSVANEIGRKESQVEIMVQEFAPRTVDLVSTAIIAVAVLAVLLLALLIVAVCFVNRYHKRKKKELTIKLEEYSTMSRENSIRRVNSISIRTQTEENIPLRGENHLNTTRELSTASVGGNSLCFPSQGDEMERRSCSTLTTMREMEVQTDIDELPPPEADEEALNNAETQGQIQTAMSHFYQENGTLRPKPTSNGIYITRKENFV